MAEQRLTRGKRIALGAILAGIVFLLVYAVLGIVAFVLTMRNAHRSLDEPDHEQRPETAAIPSLVY